MKYSIQDFKEGKIAVHNNNKGLLLKLVELAYPGDVQPSGSTNYYQVNSTGHWSGSLKCPTTLPVVDVTDINLYESLPERYVVKCSTQSETNEVIHAIDKQTTNNFGYWSYVIVKPEEIGGCNIHIAIPDGDKNYPVFTFDEWKLLFKPTIDVNNWFIVITDENQEAVKTWFGDSGGQLFSRGTGYGVMDGRRESWSDPENFTDCTEIDFNAFKRVILNTSNNMTKYTSEDFKNGKIILVNDNLEQTMKIVNLVDTESQRCEAQCNLFYMTRGKWRGSVSISMIRQEGLIDPTNLPVVNSSQIIIIDRVPIGYKLNGKVTGKQVSDLLNCRNNEVDGMFFYPGCLEGPPFKKAKELGLLDIWFTPVYESEKKTIVLTCDSESFNVEVVPGKSIAFDTNIISINDWEEISKPVSINGWKVTYDKVSIGCKKNIPMSQINEVLRAYEGN